jgi:hypothetical protein
MGCAIRGKAETTGRYGIKNNVVLKCKINQHRYQPPNEIVCQ